MEGFLNKFDQGFKIQPEEIISATNNFDDQNNYIGGGGFGRVYKGELSHAEGRSMVAIKRLDRKNGQGEAEFLKEIDTLSRYRHENLITLLGFCYHGDEAFIVYELASRGSLDTHLDSHDLTWSKRIKICLDAAKGLRYLHDPRGTHQRLIHCDVKGGNILLDDHWNAKISDFGFSITVPANELQSVVINLAAGTRGYIDPLYQKTNTLTKESDVYSFGVVLFEVLIGRQCYTYRNGHDQEILVPVWKKHYEEKKLNDIIFKAPTIQPLEQSVFEIFADMAYQCLKESREDRPEMADVVTELERALHIHELLQNPEFRAKWDAQSFYYKEIAESAEPPLNYKSEDELKNLLSKGVLLNGGKTWFSLNKTGEHCEMISIAECLGSEFKERPWYPENSRFPMGSYYSDNGIFNTRVKTQFLSSRTTYTVNLVFKFLPMKKARKCEQISLKYKLQGEADSSVVYLAYEREDGLYMAEMYKFTSDYKTVLLQIQFEGFLHYTYIEVEGIEFRPLEKVEHKEDESQPTSDSSENWEEILPIDYEDIIKRSKDSLQWTTKEEAYSIISKGFLISDDKMERGIWFYIDKNGKKCYMLSAADICRSYDLNISLPLSESRFGEAIQRDQFWSVELNYEIQSQLISSQTTYAIYLVYKLSKDQSGFEAPLRVMDIEYLGSRDNSCRYIYLISPQTPFIKLKANQNTHNPPSTLIKKGLPQLRNDGWMEVQLLDIGYATTTEMIPTSLLLDTTSYHIKVMGLIIEGIEIRPT